MANRRSISKQGHDYASAGHYFVTLCVRNRDPLLGDIVDQAMRLSDLGEIVREEWLALSKRFPTVRLDAFTIMPNHMHGIVTIVGVPLTGTPSIDQPHVIDTGNSHATGSDTPTRRIGRWQAPPLPWVRSSVRSNLCLIVGVEQQRLRDFQTIDSVACGRGATMTESSLATMN